METAQEYGVGFMVSEFGITRSAYDNYINRYVCPNYRYPDEAYQAMLVDITSTLESRGYGWCFANWYGYFGIAAPAPIVEGATYEQVGEHDYYLDQTMLG